LEFRRVLFRSESPPCEAHQRCGRASHHCGGTPTSDRSRKAAGPEGIYLGLRYSTSLDLLCDRAIQSSHYYRHHPEVRGITVPLQIGDIRIDIINDGQIMADTGGPFGLVPRALWSRYYQPDEQSRIPMHHNCLLVRTAGRTIVVDTGLGTKIPERCSASWRWPARRATSSRGCGGWASSRGMWTSSSTRTFTTTTAAATPI